MKKIEISCPFCHKNLASSNNHYVNDELGMLEIRTHCKCECSYLGRSQIYSDLPTDEETTNALINLKRNVQRIRDRLPFYMLIKNGDTLLMRHNRKNGETQEVIISDPMESLDESEYFHFYGKIIGFDSLDIYDARATIRFLKFYNNEFEDLFKLEKFYRSSFDEIKYIGDTDYDITAKDVQDIERIGDFRKLSRIRTKIGLDHKFVGYTRNPPKLFMNDINSEKFGLILEICGDRVWMYIEPASDKE